MADDKTNQEGMLSPVFVVGTISINQMEGAACFNVGNNFPSNFKSYKKHNQGFGSVHGNYNTMRELKSLLNDPDVLDTVTFPDDHEVPNWIRELIESSGGNTDEVVNAFLADDHTPVDVEEDSEEDQG